MNAPKERIMLVESDPVVSDLIARQTLVPLGFRVQVVNTAPAAIQEAVRFSPDVIIVNLTLPGLSGKDLLAAFTAQGLDTPIIVIADKGMENDVIQAFRLGAADFLSWPIREAEVVSAVERILRGVRSKREKETLTRQLNQTNQELQRRVRELTTIFAIGKAVISVTDVRELMEKIIEGAVYVTEAETGWLLLKDDRSQNFVLSAHRNLPKSMASNINQPWDDGLSSLVALSGESLAIHGEALKRFKAAALGQSALVVPMKVKKDVVGLLTVIRRSPQPFAAGSQALLEAVADYASVALVNARLFRALEERASSLQAAADRSRLGEQIVDELMHQAQVELNTGVTALRGGMDMLLGSSVGRLGAEQNNLLVALHERTKNLADLVAALDRMVLQPDPGKGPEGSNVNLNELVRKSVRRFQPLAQPFGIGLVTELSASPVAVAAPVLLIARVVDSFLSNAVRVSPPGGQIAVRLERTVDGQAHISVSDKGPGIAPNLQSRIFEPGTQPGLPTGARRFAGLAISLPLTKEIANALKGRVWVESSPGEGAVFHFSLPAR